MAPAILLKQGRFAAMGVAVKRSLLKKIQEDFKGTPASELKAYLKQSGENEKEVSMILRHLIRKQRKSKPNRLSYGDPTQASIQLHAFPKQYAGKRQSQKREIPLYSVKGHSLHESLFMRFLKFGYFLIVVLLYSDRQK